jgi:hypothetical protein
MDSSIEEKIDQILITGLSVLSKYNLEAGEADTETQTVYAWGEGSRGDVGNTFHFPPYDEDIPTMRLAPYDDKEFIVDVLGFLEAWHTIVDVAHVLNNVSYIRVYQYTRLNFTKYIEFITAYEQAGFPMWNGLDHLRTCLYQARDHIRRYHGYVYLIRAVTPDNHYKIGLSKEPVKRIVSMGVKLPFPIEVIHLIHASDRFLAEKTLHNRYVDKRVNGEWFELSAQDIQDICAIRTIDIAGVIMP